MFFEKLHSLSKSWIFKILLGLICSSFVIFGLTDLIMRFIHDKPVAKVGSLSITIDEYSRQIHQEINYINQLSKVKLDPAALKSLEIHKAVLDRLITQRALKQFFRVLNLQASENVVKDTIRSLPPFIKDGVYDGDRLIAFLKNRGISETQFVKEIEEVVYSQHLFEPITSCLTLPKLYADIFATELTNLSVFKVVEIDFSKIPADQVVDDASLELFYEKNKENYRKPEYRSVEYVFFDPEHQSQYVGVSEAEIQEKYEEIKHQYAEPEGRFVQKITFDSHESAKNALERLEKQPESKRVGFFKKLAAEYKGAVYENLELIERNTLDPEVEKVVFSLPLNGVSGVVFINKNQHTLYQVTGIKPLKEKRLVDIKDFVVKELQREKYLENFEALRNAFEDGLASGKSLDKVAEEFHLKVQKPVAFDQLGKDMSGNLITLDRDPEDQRFIIRQAFNQSTLFESQIYDFEPGKAVAIRVVKIDPSSIPAFQLIKEKVKNDFYLDVKKKKINKLISNLQKEIDKDESFEKKVKDYQLGVVHTYQLRYLDLESKTFPKTKDGLFFSKLPQNILRKLFKTPLLNLYVAEVSSDKVLLFYPEKITPDKVKNIDLALRIEKNINNGIAKDVSSYMGQIAKNRIEVVINQEIVERLNRAMTNGD